MIQANELRVGKSIIEVSGKYVIPTCLKETHFTWLVGTTKDGEKIYNPFIPYTDDRVKPIPLTEELILKCVFCGQELELWNENKLNDNEYHKRYVFHNVIDGTSNLEIHVIHYSYSEKKYITYQLSVDYDEWQGFKDLEYLHQLQNGVHWVTGKELEINL